MSPVEQYIAEQPEAYRQRLSALRQAILSADPRLEEAIAWGMPTFRLRRNVIHFALARRHIGLYPGAGAVAHFAPRLADFSHSKGTIRLPHDRELPLELVREITAWCVKQEEQK